MDVNAIKFSTIELTGGFALRFNFTSHLTWRLSFGPSLYHHLNYLPLINHMQTMVTLSLGSGLIFTIR